jgi:farnesyl diphosphate synthase
MMTALNDALTGCQQRVENALKAALPNPALTPTRLHEAMHYAALSPGKRLRPFLVYQAGALLGETGQALDAPACAVEMIHAYSLVHDDLPAMDDDDLRRGQPTCHRAFDEATAILVGDGLQALAFRLIAAADTPAAPQRLEMINVLSEAMGSRGMVGGQAMDLGAVGQTLSIAELEDMHIHKTGALILASLRLGALCATHGTAPAREQLERYGRCIGLAFQVQDDILDRIGDTEKIGKASGADALREKPTYPGLLGLTEAKRFAQTLCEQAILALEDFGHEADTLRDLATFIITRDR